MAEETRIAWCDATFNPWVGCTKVSAGCDHCYAEALDGRFGGGHWGPGAPRRRTSGHYWSEPRRWDRKAAAAGKRLRVFCASMADWLDNAVPAEWLADLLFTIGCTPNLDWLLLTKRIQIWRSRLEAVTKIPDAIPSVNPLRAVAADKARLWLDGVPPANVWLGTTVENKAEADRRIPHLLDVPAAVRFLSCEPLLGPVDLRNIKPPGLHIGDAHGFSAIWKNNCIGRPCIDWVICGGENGAAARPMRTKWARSLRDQCAAAGVPFFFKQWGEWAPAADFASETQEDYDVRGLTDGGMIRIGKKAAGHLLDGVEHFNWPTVS